MLFNASTRQPLGLGIAQPEKVRVKLRGGTAVVAGDIVKFDIASTDTTSVVHSLNSGGASDPLSNVILSAATDASGSDRFFHGVALEAIADDGEGFVAIRGMVDAKVVTASGTAGRSLSVAGTGTLDLPASGDWVCAIAQESPVASPALTRVIFDGINGFGTG